MEQPRMSEVAADEHAPLDHPISGNHNETVL